MIIWNEIEFGKYVYDNSSVKTKKWQYKELKCLIRYLLSENKKPKEIRESLEVCCDDNIKYLNARQKKTIFDKLIQQCKVSQGSNIIKITIYKNEIEKIKQVNNDKLERILFVLLVYKKWLGDIDWLSILKSDLFKECHLTGVNSKQQEVLLHSLFETKIVQSDVIKLNRKQYHRGQDIKKQMWKLDFSDCDKGEIALEFDNYKNFIFRYLNYCGDNLYYECEKCRGMFKQNKNKTKKLCNECSVYAPIGNKVLICVDCGVEFKVDGKVKKQERCVECYSKYRKIKIKENVSNYRKKQKM